MHTCIRAYLPTCLPVCQSPSFMPLRFVTTPSRRADPSAITPGTTGLRDAFETVSERIIRHLTSRASWASRPASPSREQGQDGESHHPGAMQGGEEPVQSTNHYDGFFPGANTEPVSDPDHPDPALQNLEPNYSSEMSGNGIHPLNLDEFLFNPLAEFNADDWDKVIDAAVGASQGSFPFT